MQDAIRLKLGPDSLSEFWNASTQHSKWPISKTSLLAFLGFPLSPQWTYACLDVCDFQMLDRVFGLQKFSDLFLAHVLSLGYLLSGKQP